MENSFSRQIFPYALQVRKGLVPLLDDKKRLVRREAVDCRSAWYAAVGRPAL